ncbi:MAG: hypothetical protein Kow0069_25330 [Promethearchaeota archaeon]
MDDSDTQALSIGRLVLRETFVNNTLIPEEVKAKISGKGDYFLLIFIPRDDVVKVSLFPCKTPKIKKLLIQLEEFSPELVKGISTALKQLNLADHIMHTTGLCFSAEKCFYETYLDASNLEAGQLGDIRAEFERIPRVLDVSIVEVELK